MLTSAFVSYLWLARTPGVLHVRCSTSFARISGQVNVRAPPTEYLSSLGGLHQCSGFKISCIGQLQQIHCWIIYSFKMPMPGYVFKDGGPIPDSELEERQSANEALHTQQDVTHPSTSDSSKFSTPSSNAAVPHPPTESHALALNTHAEPGAVERNSTTGEVKDLGWFEDPQHVPPLVGGLKNEELWMFLRRFNKQMYHVKAMTAYPPGGLDLNIADEDEFSPDKLRSNVERFYMDVILGLMGMGNHIARLRSWREPRRTGAFLAVGDIIIS